MNVEYLGTFCSVLFGFRKCNKINSIAILSGYLESVLQVPRHIVFFHFWSINPIKPMWASDLPMFSMALKPKDVRVPLPVQLILDCHWLVCVWGEGLTIGQLCLFFLFSSIESWQMPSRPLTGLRERCPLQGTVYTRCWDWRKGPQQRTLKEPTGTLNTVTLTCSYSDFFRNSG